MQVLLAHLGDVKRGAKDSGRAPRQDAVDRGRHPRQGEAQQTMGVRLPDRDEPHRRRNGRGQPGVGVAGECVALGDSATATDGRKRHRERRSKPPGCTSASICSRRISGCSPCHVFSRRNPIDRFARRAVDEARSAVSSSSIAATASQSAASTAGHARTIDGPSQRPNPSSRRISNHAPRSAAPVTRPLAAADSRPSE